MSAENEEKKQDEDVSSRFFNPETDERLKPPTELPEPPKANFKRPNTKTANPDKGSDGFRIGGSTMSGSEVRSAGLASTLGIGLVASIVAGTLVGYGVDYLLKNKGTPWGLIIGFFIGVVAGFVNLIRTANKITRDEESNRQ